MGAIAVFRLNNRSVCSVYATSNEELHQMDVKRLNRRISVPQKTYDAIDKQGSLMLYTKRGTEDNADTVTREMLALSSNFFKRTPLYQNYCATRCIPC